MTEGTRSMSQALDNSDSESSMPWDEANDFPTTTNHRALQEHGDWKSSLIGTPSDQWRRIGEARRRLILEEDRRNGGMSFALNTTCSVDRYFQVAYRALEQFHQMYEEGRNLEEAYIMGNRMISFLTECLPNHPDFRRREVTEQRKKSRACLGFLRQCLEDLALKIDEEQCNQFADDFDPIAHEEDSETDDEDEISRSVEHEWSAFGELKEKRQAESPTGTVATCSTASLEVTDYSSSDDSMPERRIDFSDYEEPSKSQESILLDLSTEFLERIAGESVEYETDSEAEDSWAQGDDTDSIASSWSSGEGVTCDPARIALQHMKLGSSKMKFRSPIRAKDTERLSAFRLGVASAHPDPPTVFSRHPSREEHDHPECSSLPARRPNRPSERLRETTVVSEIQRFLDASFEYDPSRVFDSSMERLNRESHTNRNSSDRSGRSHDALYSVGEKENTMFFNDAVNDDGWVAFDPSLGPSRNFRAPDFYGRFSS